MDLLSELMKKLSLNTFDSGNSYWVDITHINNPHSFYVRPTAYRSFMNDVQAHGDPIASTEIQTRAMVIFKSKTLKKYARGLILFTEMNQDTSNCDIFTPDYGFIEKSVKIQNMFKLKSPNIPPLAIQCQLADCKPIGNTWTDREIDAMKYYVSGERAKMFVREKTPDALTVELINSCPDDIATMLALTGYSTMGYGENTISRLTAPDCDKLFFTYKELKVNDILHVRTQTGKELNKFYVADKSDYKRYINEQENFNYFSKKLKQFNADDLEVDKSVGVFMESTSKYERGIIKEVLSENKARVQLIDWGNIIEVHISSMKNMSEKFYHYPATAVYCTVDEEQSLDNRLLKYLYPGYEFLIEIKELGDAFHKPNVVKIMPLS